MRILFTSGGGRGHSDPLLPIACAAREAGHTVAFCVRPPMGAVIEAAGFAAVEAGPPIVVRATLAPLLELDAEREDRVLREGFARRSARARATSSLHESWRPDVVVADETDFGPLVAAERLDLPYASVVTTAAGSFLRPEVVGPPLDELRASQGLAPDPDGEALHRFLVLAPGPPRFRDPRFPLPATAHPIRPAALEPAPGDLSMPLTLDSDRPTVACTLGTVFNMESGDLFDRLLRGLARLPVEVVATVGLELDPAALGPRPPHVHVVRYVPQAVLLPHCRAVVSHGGSGSVLGAIAHGLPSVLVPMGADQPHNAGRCAALGVGRVLTATSCTPDEVRDATAAVLDDPGYAARAGRLRAEILALPGPDHAVALLERLAVERRPIPHGCPPDRARRSAAGR